MSRPDSPAGKSDDPSPVGRWTAVAISSGAIVVPLAMSASSAPAPIHPVTFAWYLSLRQPWFKPPDALLPLAWTGIEAGLAVAAYRLLRAAPAPARSRALALLAANVLAIGGWSRLFFGRRRIGAGAAVAAGMVATGAALFHQAARVDKPAAHATLPFVAWVGFATLLTTAIWRLNRSPP